jgi:glycosyltransferase involved in cell wall biosynthesis
MHLAIVSPYPPSITGIGQYGFHVSRLLAQSGLFAHLTVLTGSSGGPPEGMPSSVSIQPAWQTEQLSASMSILTRLHRIKPDLVWFNMGASVFGRSPLVNLLGFFAPYMSRRMGYPTVVTLHELVELADLRSLNAPGGPLAPYGARLLTGIGLQADVICLTMQRYVDWLAVRKPGSRRVHIPIGAYHPPEMLPESNSPELLFFTTLAPFKGLETLLKAFPSLQMRHPGLRLTIAGAEHARFRGYSRDLRAQYERLANIRWLGQVPEENVRELFSSAQIVVLPYSASTGSSSVLYQAATWGRPAVVSDLPETRAVVNESGLEVTFFESGNPASLEQSLSSQLDSAQSRRMQVEKNFAAIQRHRPEETCRAYLQAFNLALEVHRSQKRLAIPSRVSRELL